MNDTPEPTSDDQDAAADEAAIVDDTGEAPESTDAEAAEDQPTVPIADAWTDPSAEPAAASVTSAPTSPPAPVTNGATPTRRSRAPSWVLAGGVALAGLGLFALGASAVTHGLHGGHDEMRFDRQAMSQRMGGGPGGPGGMGAQRGGDGDHAGFGRGDDDGDHAGRGWGGAAGGGPGGMGAGAGTGGTTSPPAAPTAPAG